MFGQNGDFQSKRVYNKNYQEMFFSVSVIEKVACLMKNVQCKQINPSNQSPKAFTLIELLVVISIIALLVAILLPALNKARGMAQGIVCRSHERGAVQGIHVYAAAHDDWMPGPNTSGVALGGGGMGDLGNPGNLAPVLNGSSAPTQNMDWMSPSLGESLGLPADPVERLKHLFNTDMRCPAKKAMYGEWTNTSAFPPGTMLYANSYSAIINFHLLSGATPQGSPEIYDDVYLAGLAKVGKNTRKLSIVGNHAQKAFLVEGSRYVNMGVTPYEVTFNSALRQIAGGNFMLHGPTNPQTGDPFREMLYPQHEEVNFLEAHEELCYVHNKRMNVAFFDGHVEGLTPEESLDVNMYYPRGATILAPQWTQDPRIRNSSKPVYIK